MPIVVPLTLELQEMDAQGGSGLRTRVFRRGDRDAPIVVLIPVYNDWEACGKLLARLDEVLSGAGREAAVLLVDDGSTLPHGLLQLSPPLRAIRAIDVLALRRNLGHQRAICIGLSHIEKEYDCQAVVVMDGDGEDDPEDVPRLLQQWEAGGRESIVFAERTRRSEGWVFRVGYLCYRVLHRVLTGQGVRVGNFSVVPCHRLRSLVVVAELWSHYAAAVFISRLPFTMVPTRRATRLAGRPTTNYVSLVMHGLSAISVFSEVVSVRVLLATFYLGLGAATGLATVAGIRLLTPWAVPGWAPYAAGLLTVVLLLVVGFAFLFSFTVLFDRKSAAMLPARDYPYFIDRVLPLFSRSDVPRAAGGESSVGP